MGRNLATSKIDIITDISRIDIFTDTRSNASTCVVHMTKLSFLTLIMTTAITTLSPMLVQDQKKKCSIDHKFGIAKNTVYLVGREIRISFLYHPLPSLNALKDMKV